MDIQDSVIGNNQSLIFQIMLMLNANSYQLTHNICYRSRMYEVFMKFMFNMQRFPHAGVDVFTFNWYEVVGNGI